jgi:hypothetical protein
MIEIAIATIKPLRSDLIDFAIKKPIPVKSKKSINIDYKTIAKIKQVNAFIAKAKEQDNRCAVCHKEFESTPHIDHNHGCCPKLRSCDKCRRDLLCSPCNVMIGMSQVTSGSSFPTARFRLLAR